MKVGRFSAVLCAMLLLGSVAQAQLIKAFNSVAVANNYRAELKGNKTDVVSITWTSASLNKPNVNLLYSFQLDTVGGSFGNPLSLITRQCCNGFFTSDTSIEIPYDYLASEIEFTLNKNLNKSFKQGDSITLNWIIMCNAAGPNATYENLQSQIKTITFVRGQFDTEYIPINLVTPLDNSSFFVEDNPNVNLKFQWTDAYCPTGCADATYTIMFDSLGGDFSNPLYFFKIPQSSFDTLFDLRQDVLAQMMYDDNMPTNTPKTYKWTVEVFGNGEQFFALTPRRISLLRGLMRYENTPFFLQQPVDNAVFKLETNTHDSIEFSWNKTRSGFPDGAKYSILFSSTPVDFSKPLFKLNTTVGDTMYYARYGELRDSLDKKFGKNWLIQDLKWTVEADIIGYKFMCNDTNDLRLARGFFTNVKENDLAQVKVYPNPAKQQLNISFDTETYITAYEICDAMGRIVSTAKINKEVGLLSIDIESLRTGIYYIRLQNQNNTFAPKAFVKQ